MHLPESVKVSIENNVIAMEGPNGKAELVVNPALTITHDKAAAQIAVTLSKSADATSRDDRKHRPTWGTTRKLIANMVEGITKGYTRQVQVVGVGYGARLEGGNLVLRCGLAHEVSIPVPQGVTVDPPETGSLAVSGAGQVPCTTLTFRSTDKQRVGQFAAAVRRVRPPEPYKGKGIRYVNEEVKRKAGKALAAGTS